MLECYTINKDNLVSRGITIKKDLINKCSYIAPEGKIDGDVVKLYSDINKPRVLNGELFNHVYKESTVNGEKVDGTLVMLNWECKIKGGRLYSNLNTGVAEGKLKEISKSHKYEGMSLDFKEKIYTTTYLIKVIEDCDVEFNSIVDTGSVGKYEINERFRIRFKRDKEPKIIKITDVPSSYRTT